MRRFYTGSDLNRVHSIAELADMARRRLPYFAWEYLSGGAEAELTLKDNLDAFSAYGLHARAMVPCHVPDTSRVLLGRVLPLPMLIGPTGYNGLLHRDADIHLARAATARGLPFSLSTASNTSLEDLVAAVPGVDLWFQLYAMRDPRVQNDLLQRAAAVGCRTLVLTCDAMVLGNREWDRRNKFDVLRHPRWLKQVMWPSGLPGMGNLEPYLPPAERNPLGSMAFIGKQMDTLLDWDMLARLRDRWGERLLLKGVLHPADVERAIALGLDGVVVSNHGGRQLDGALGSLDALAAIAPQAQGKLSLLLDGGIRRGSDIVKALALGVDAVLLGRSTLYGVAVAGEAGVGKALDVLTDELALTMNLMGCTHLNHLDRDSVFARRRA
jgi:(S)-mandelate dehydrogenase